MYEKKLWRTEVKWNPYCKQERSPLLNVTFGDLSISFVNLVRPATLIKSLALATFCGLRALGYNPFGSQPRSWQFYSFLHGCGVKFGKVWYGWLSLLVWFSQTLSGMARTYYNKNFHRGFIPLSRSSYTRRIFNLRCPPCAYPTNSSAWKVFL